MTDDDTLADQKAAMRAVCHARRAAIDPQAAAAAAAALARQVSAQVDITADVIVSGYWPLSGELDPRPALDEAAQRGAALVLPRVAGDGRPLIFHRWRAQDPLIEGRFKVMEPDPAAPVIAPTILLVPLLAFDAACRRLGHGKGYYDRTLAGLRRDNPGVLAIGVAFAAQQVDRVPTDVHDQPLDLVITERAVHRPTVA